MLYFGYYYKKLLNKIFISHSRFIIPYLYLPEYLKIHEYDTAASAQLISAIGIAQTIGMIGLGYVGDRSWMNVNVCYSGCMICKYFFFFFFFKIS